MEAWVIVIAGLFIVGVLLWPVISDPKAWDRMVRWRREGSEGRVRSEQATPGSTGERWNFYPLRRRRRRK